LHTERKETRDYSLEGRLEALLKLNPDEQEAILGDATKALLSDRKRNLLLNERIQKDLDPATHNTAQRARTLLGLSPSRKRLLLSLPPYNIQYSNILKGQTPTGSLTFAVNPTDETNVLKSNVNPKPDKSFALGGTFLHAARAP
jgi:hypothetical protein